MDSKQITNFRFVITNTERTINLINKLNQKIKYYLPKVKWIRIESKSDVKDGGSFWNFTVLWNKALLVHNSKKKDTMKDVISQVHEWIKLVSQVGIGLIALGIVVEIVFAKARYLEQVSFKTCLR